MIRNIEIIVPFYNDFDNFKEFVRILDNFKSKNCKFLLIDNGSTENLILDFYEKSNQDNNNWRALRSETNLGFGGGVKFGINNSDANYVGWMPGNLKVSPDNVIEIFDNIDNLSNIDLIKCKRVGRSFIPKLKTIIFGILVSIFFQRILMDAGGTPNLINKKAYLEFKNSPNDFSFDMFIYFASKYKQYNITRPPIFYNKRMYGESHWQKNFFSEVKLLYEIIKSKNIWIKYLN